MAKKRIIKNENVDLYVYSCEGIKNISCWEVPYNCFIYKIIKDVEMITICNLDIDDIYSRYTEYYLINNEYITYKELKNKFL